MTIPEMLLGCLLRIILPCIAIMVLAAWVGERVFERGVQNGPDR